MIARVEDQGPAGPCAERNRLLAEAGSEWVLLVDDDAHPEPGCLERLLAEAAKDSYAAAISPRVLSAGDPGLIDYDGGRAHFLADLSLENRRTRACDAARPTTRPGAASSCALLVHRQRALDAGGFDPRMVMFRDDLEFTLRLRQRGWTLRHCPDALVLHGRPGGRKSALHARRTFYQTRNRWWIILKLYEARTILLTLPLQLAYEALAFGRAARRGELGQWLGAWLDLAWNLRALLQARRSAQRERLMSDRRLLEAPPLVWVERHEPRAARLFSGLCAAWWRRV